MHVQNLQACLSKDRFDKGRVSTGFNQPAKLHGAPDIIDCVEVQGPKGHLTRMHSVRRAYVDAQRKARS